jgi:hypothetical protein
MLLMERKLTVVTWPIMAAIMLLLLLLPKAVIGIT